MGRFLCIRRQNFSRQKGVFQYAEKGWKYLQTQGWTLGRTLHSRKKNNRAVMVCLWSNVPWGEGKQRFAAQNLTQMNGTRVREQYTLRMVADKWFYHTKPQVKESTYRKYQNVWTWYIEPALGNMPVSQLKNQHIESFCTELRVSGGIRKSGLSARNSHCCRFSSQKYAAFSRQIGYFCLLWFAGSYRAAGTDGYPCVPHTTSKQFYADISCRIFRLKTPESCCACSPAFVWGSFAPSVGKIYACRIVYCTCSTPCSESKPTCRPIKRRR